VIKAPTPPTHHHPPQLGVTGAGTPEENIDPSELETKILQSLSILCESATKGKKTLWKNDNRRRGEFATNTIGTGRSELFLVAKGETGGDPFDCDNS